MIANAKIPSFIEVLLTNLWRLVEDFVDTNNQLGFQQQDVRGETEIYQKSQDRLLIVYLGVLMYLRRLDGDSDELIFERFGGIEKIQKILGCRRISYKKFIDLVLPASENISKGVGAEVISETFEVGYESFDKFFSQADIKRLLDLDNCCVFIAGKEQDALGLQSDNDGLSTQGDTLIRI